MKFGIFRVLRTNAIVCGLGLAAFGAGLSAMAQDVVRFGAPLPLTGALAPEGF